MSDRFLLCPDTVSDRPVTNRGVHLGPSGYQPWMETADYWLDLLVSMGMSWVVLYSASDACIQSGAVEALLEAGVIPIIRFTYQFPRPWVEGETVKRLVRIYNRYDLKPLVIFGNEPFDDREWVVRVPPEETAWQIISKRWEEMARDTINAGALPGFPDGPCYSQNPFLKTPRWIWDTGLAWYAGHHYGKGRPPIYPYDPVSRTGLEPNGEPLTREQYEAALDDFAGDPSWNKLIYNPGLLFVINEQRRLWADPNINALDDDTCFMGWERVQEWSLEALGYVVPMAMTEGGWAPCDRAGSGSNVDLRWPYTTPRKVAEYTLQMYNMDTPLFAICPWLLGSESLGGSGWPYDAWTGWAYSDKYGFEKPVVQVLKENPPQTETGGLPKLEGLLSEALLLLKGVV